MTTLFPFLIIVSLVGLCSSVGPSHKWNRPDAPLSELYDAFFTELPTSQACIGMTNGRGETQCYAKHRTSPFFLIESEDDWKRLKVQDGNWAVVLNLKDIELERKFFKSLKEMSASRVNAIVVRYPSYSHRPTHESPLGVIPNYDISIYNSSVSPKWNPEGTGLFSMPLPLIVRVNTSDHNAAVKAAKLNVEQGYSYPLHSAQFNYAMQSADESLQECLLSEHCSPFGGWSLWGATKSATEIHNITEPVKFVAVAAPLDVSNLFTQYYVPGASVIGGLLAMLTAADAIKDRRDEMINPALFFFFAGSQYGESGASRLLKDIFNFTSYEVNKGTKISVDADLKALTEGNNSIQYFLSLDQIGSGDPPSGNGSINQLGMYTYSDQTGVRGGSQPTQATSKLVQELKKNGAKQGQPYLPPTSTHTLLNIPGVSDSDIGVATLAGYPKQYLNRYLGSSYDVPSSDRFNATIVLQTAATLTDTIWSLSGATTPAPSVNETVFSELFYCFTRNVSCDLFLKYRQVESLETLHTKQYASSNNWSPRTHRSSDLGVITWFIAEFMRDRWPDEKLSSNDSCFAASHKQLYKGSYGCPPEESCIATADTNTSEMVPFSTPDGEVKETNRTGTCKLTSVRYYSAMSPGIEGYFKDGKYRVNTKYINYYPSYAVSKYNSLSNGFRIFVQDSVAREVCRLVSFNCSKR